MCSRIRAARFAISPVWRRLTSGSGHDGCCMHAGPWLAVVRSGFTGQSVHWSLHTAADQDLPTGRLTAFLRLCDTIRDVILTCARKPTWVGLICRTETTTKKCKTEKLKSKSRHVRSNRKSLGNHIVSSEEEKEKLQWEGFAEKEGFESGLKERVGDEKLIIITNKCNC